MDFTKAIAVVTGGASGLGYASAQKIVSAGGCAALLECNSSRADSMAVALST